MTKLKVFVFFLCLVTFCIAENKGFCPPAPTNVSPSKKADHPISTDSDKSYFGTVTVLTVVSDTGYVCSAHVISGINKELDKKTEIMVKEWRLEPARKNDKAVPVFLSLDVNYWKTSKGEIVSDPPPPKSSTSPKEP